MKNNWILAILAIALVALVPICADTGDADDEEGSTILTPYPIYGEEQEPALYVSHAHFEYDEDGNLITSEVDEEIPIYADNYTGNLDGFTAGEAKSYTYSTSNWFGWGNSYFRTPTILDDDKVAELTRGTSPPFSGAKKCVNVTVTNISASKVNNQCQLTMTVEPTAAGTISFTLCVIASSDSSFSSYSTDYFAFSGTAAANTTTRTISFDSNGGSSVSSKSGIDGTSITLPSAPTKSGYTFLGWKYSGTTYNAGASFTIRGDATFIAQWAKTITVSFNSNGGSSTSSITSYAGGTITLPSAPTNSGYQFKGWYKSTSSTATRYGGAGSSYTISSSQSSNFTMYAQWLVQEYTVYVDANGGTASYTSTTVTANCTLHLPTATKSGYVLTGWYSSKTGGTYYGSGGGTYNITSLSSDFTIYAQWTEASITVYFDANGGSVSPSSKSATPGYSVSLPTPTKSGHEFKGWYSSTYGGTSYGKSSYTVPSSQTSDFTMYAQWDEIYTISFVTDGGSSVSAKTGISGKVITLPSTTKSGYTFAGWYTSDSGGDRVGGSGTSYTIYENATLYAHWDAPQITMTIKLGGWDEFSIISPSQTQSKFYADTTITMSAGDKLDVDWYKASKTEGSASSPTYCITEYPSDSCYYESFGGSSDKDGIFPTSSGTVNPAKSPSQTPSYTYYSEVKYNVTGTTISNTTGSGSNQNSINHTLTYSEPTKSGYRFVGWSKTDGASTATYTAGQTVQLSKGLTNLYPVWKEQVTITYNLNNGTMSGNTTVSIDKGSSITLPTPTKTNYSFQGWYSDSQMTLSSKIGDGGSSYTFNSNTTLYAKWQLDTVTLTFNVENDSFYISVARGAIADLSGIDSSKTTRDGCHFYGWFTDSRCTGEAFDFSKPIETDQTGLEFYGIFETILEIQSVPAASAKVTAVSENIRSFNIVSASNVSKVVWDFGDGNTSTSRDCFHTYESAGTYHPTLTVYSGDETITYELDDVEVKHGIGGQDFAKLAIAAIALVIVSALVARRFI